MLYDSSKVINLIGRLLWHKKASIFLTSGIPELRKQGIASMAGNTPEEWKTPTPWGLENTKAYIAKYDFWLCDSICIILPAYCNKQIGTGQASWEYQNINMNHQMVSDANNLKSRYKWATIRQSEKNSQKSIRTRI